MTNIEKVLDDAADVITKTRLSKKDSPKTSKSESDFAKTLEGQVQSQLNDAIVRKAVIEAAILSWATVEQIFIPRLIKFIAGNLKVAIPSSIFDRPTSVVLDFYFFLSHDDALYKLLKEGNQLRNRLVHRLYKENNLKNINKLALRIVLLNTRKIYRAFIERFDGKVKIPSLMLYANGWNDCCAEMDRRVRAIVG